MRVVISPSVVVLGFALGLYELFQHHWFAGAGYFSSALLTGGLILVGASFVKDSWCGAPLAIVTAVCGVYGFFFENRGLDVNLDKARFKVAMTLAQPTSGCPSSSSSSLFQKGAQACFLQANRDKLSAVADGAKLAYLPPQLDLADKIWSSATGQKPDKCQELFLQAYRECPAAFSSIAPATIKKLQSQD